MVDVAYCFDENYWKFAYVSLYSLLKSKSGDSDVRVYCAVPAGFSPWIKSFSVALAGKFNADIVFREVAVGENPFEKFRLNGASETIFYRLFLHRLFPDLDRILFLDGDTMVEEDLSALCGMDMEGCIIAAVRDSGNIVDPYMAELSRKGLIRAGNYVNAGVVLQDLGEMKLAEDRFFRPLDFRPAYMDQDLLNMACSDRIKFLPLKYNVSPEVHYTDRYDNALLFGPEEVAEARLRPAISHFYGFRLQAKPHLSCSTPEQRRWRSLVEELGNLDIDPVDGRELFNIDMV